MRIWPKNSILVKLSSLSSISVGVSLKSSHYVRRWNEFIYFEYIDLTCYLLESLVQCQHVRLDRRWEILDRSRKPTLWAWIYLDRLSGFRQLAADLTRSVDFQYLRDLWRLVLYYHFYNRLFSIYFLFCLLLLLIYYTLMKQLREESALGSALRSTVDSSS